MTNVSLLNHRLRYLISDRFSRHVTMFTQDDNLTTNNVCEWLENCSPMTCYLAGVTEISQGENSQGNSFIRSSTADGHIGIFHVEGNKGRSCSWISNDGSTTCTGYSRERAVFSPHNVPIHIEITSLSLTTGRHHLWPNDGHFFYRNVKFLKFKTWYLNFFFLNFWINMCN